MPDIAGVLNIEVRLPLVEGPGFLQNAFMELEDEGTVALGVINNRGQVYAYARIDETQFWRIADALFPGGRPADDAEVRRDGH
jgi:hypothetical protein